MDKIDKQILEILQENEHSGRYESHPCKRKYYGSSGYDRIYRFSYRRVIQLMTFMDSHIVFEPSKHSCR